MNLPHRRTPERHALDQDILAAIRLEEHWPQITSFAEDPFANGRAFGDVVIENSPRFTLIRIAFLPTAACSSFPWPPMFAVRLAVNDAFTGDGDVPLLEGIDERRITHQFHPFPARENVGQILSWILTEFDRGAFRQMEIDVAFQTNRAGQKLAWRHYDAAAATDTASVDCFSKYIGEISFATANRAELR